MRIKYNLLWIEDNHEWLLTTKEIFEQKLEDLGFKLEVEEFKNGDTIDKNKLQNGFSEYDLILIDFNLGDSDKGNVIIEKIRNNNIYTDILFYSQNYAGVNEKVKELGLEGVYISNRDNIENKFEKVMKTTIKKIQEVNTLRGLIMAETSEMDHLMENILMNYLKNNSGDKNNKLAKKMIKKVRDSFKDNEKDFKKIEDINDGSSLLDKTYFDSYKKARSINDIIEIDFKPEFENIKNCNECYIEEVISMRNNFAHVKEEIIDGKKILKSIKTGSELIFNEEKCIEIRKNLIKHRENLEKLLSIL